ncbi:MAG: serine hydrolase [Simkaniaceae bacterium]|nr:serine hydrolase [Simkaniaceae bacterium]
MWLYSFLFFSFIFLNSLCGQTLPLNIQSRYAVLMNADNGCILYQKRAHESMYPGSTIKIATALFVLEKLQDQSLDKMICAPSEVLKKVSPSYKFAHLNELPPYILQTDGTHFFILPNEELSYRMLLHGLLLSSGNDAANVMAYHLGGESISKFMEEMNIFLKKIGCRHTHLCNPHGLHHPSQITTAYDMAVVARKAMQNPLIREIVAKKEYERPKTNKQGVMRVAQGNKLIADGRLQYAKAIGLKTGYTSGGQYCLLASATEGGRHLIASLYASKEHNFRYHDAIEMFSRAFEEKPLKRVLFNAHSDPLFIKNFYKTKRLEFLPKEDIEIEYYLSESPEISFQLKLNKKLKLPIRLHQEVGVLQVIIADQIEREVPLYAVRRINKVVYERIDFWVISVMALFLMGGWIRWRKGFGFVEE